MPAPYQSLKSANLARVDAGKSYNLYASRENLGQTLLCPASAQQLQHDVYGRPANQNTLSVNLDASCGQGTQFNAMRHIQRENMERPYLPVCAAGNRGAADFMGVGRDIIPQNLYGEGQRGNMIRHYNTQNDAPWENQVNQPSQYYWRIEQPYSYSHDSTKSAYWNG